jgi:hypothetical protein
MKRTTPNNDRGPYDCPVCYIRMTGKIFICPGGHSICEKCYPTMPRNECGLCRKKYEGTRNYQYEECVKNAIDKDDTEVEIISKPVVVTPKPLPPPELKVSCFLCDNKDLTEKTFITHLQTIHSNKVSPLELILRDSSREPGGSDDKYSLRADLLDTEWDMKPCFQYCDDKKSLRIIKYYPYVVDGNFCLTVRNFPQNWHPSYRRTQRFSIKLQRDVKRESGLTDLMTQIDLIRREEKEEKNLYGTLDTLENADLVIPYCKLKNTFPLIFKCEILDK